MASDSQTATATTSEKPLENKVKEEAKLMEKEIVLPETADVVKDEPVSDSNLTVTKEEKIVQTPAGEQEVAAEESTEKGTAENGEKKVADEQVEVKEPTLVKEGVETEEKQILESVAEEANKVVEASESKHVEQVEVQIVREAPEETVEDKVKDVEVLEVETKPEASEKAKEMGPEVEVVKTEETPETTEQAKVEPEASPPADVIEKAITEEKHVVEEPSKDEQENISEAQDVLTKVATEEENIKKDTETPAVDDKSEETLKKN